LLLIKLQSDQWEQPGSKLMYATRLALLFQASGVCDVKRANSMNKLN